MDLIFWELLLKIPVLLLFVSIVSIPLFIHRVLTFSVQNKLVKIATTFVFSLPISGLLTIAMVYYSVEVSNDFLLREFGYNENGMNDLESFKNVSSENILRLKDLRKSQMGLGWPLKAMFAFAFFALPSNLIMSIIVGMKLSFTRKNREGI